MADRRERVSVDVKVTGERDLDKLGRTVDDVGDELKDTSRDASHLDRELDRLQRTTHELNKEFAKSGDKTVLDKIKSARKELAPLQAVRRELDRVAATEAKAVRDRQAAAKKADADRLKRMLTPQRGPIASRIGMDIPTDANSLLLYGGLGAALALPLGATAGGAILAGGALAGVGLGVAGAAMGSPAIGDAAKTALADESARWQQASRAFEEPTLRAIATIKDAVDDIPLEQILKNSAEFVGPLTHGIAGFTRALGEGIGVLIEDAKPVVDVLARELPRLGESFKAMFEEIGEGSEGGAEALQDILHVTSRLVIGLGIVIHRLEDAYEKGVALRKKLPGDMWSDDEVRVDGFSKAIRGADVAMTDLSATIYDAAEHTGILNDEFDKFFGRAKDSREAARDYEAAIDDLTAGFDRNGRSIDLNTEAGRKNDELIQKRIDSIKAVRDAAIAEGGGTAEATAAANAKYQEQLRLLAEQLRRLGATPAAIALIVGAYQQIPADVWTTVHVRADLRSIENVQEQMAVRLGRRASGGPVSAGKTYLVGEQGPELVTFGDNGYVHNAGATRAMSGGGWSGGGGSVGVMFAGNISDPVSRMFMELVRTGRIQLSAGGQRVGAG